MKKNILFLCFVVIAFPLFSQVGYMGKRFIINADARVTPAWIRPNHNGETGYTKFNYFLEPGVEFIVNKKSSVGATFLSTQGLFPVQIHAYGEVDFKYDNYIARSTFDAYQPITDNKFSSKGLGLYYKYYYGESTAPIGKYIKFQIDYMSYNYTVNEINVASYLDSPPANYSYILYPEEKGSGSTFGCKMEFGRDFLLFNYLRLSTGISFGLTLKGYSTAFTDSFDSVIYDFNDANRETVPVTDFVDGQLLGQYWFGLKMGIGLIAF